MNKNGIIGISAKMTPKAINFFPIPDSGLLISRMIYPIITVPSISQQCIKKHVIDIMLPLK